MLLKPEHNAVAAANAAAVITLPAVNLRGHRLTGLDWAYSGDPIGGSIKIEDGAGNVVWGPMPVTNGGPGQHSWPGGIEGTPNTAMIITMASGGSGISCCIKALVEV